jgi:hypothetical protein
VRPATAFTNRADGRARLTVNVTDSQIPGILTPIRAYPLRAEAQSEPIDAHLALGLLALLGQTLLLGLDGLGTQARASVAAGRPRTSSARDHSSYFLTDP